MRWLILPRSPGHPVKGIQLRWTETLEQNLCIFKWIIRRVDQAACPRDTPIYACHGACRSVSA